MEARCSVLRRFDEKLIETLEKDLRLYQRNIGETQSIALENDEYKGCQIIADQMEKKLNYIKAVEVFEKKSNCLKTQECINSSTKILNCYTLAKQKI